MLDLLFSNVNLPLTILSGILVLYWLLTMFTGIDWDVDFDVDIDVDFDADLEMDTHVEGAEISLEDAANIEVDKDQVVKNRRKPLKWWQIVLIHFNFVGLPFMFTLTAWILFWWIGTLLATSITNSSNSIFGFVWFFALILPTLYITKIFTSPFKSFFKSLNKDGDRAVDYVGLQGKLLDSINNESIGRVEIWHNDSSLIINVKAFKGEAITHGQSVLVIQSNKDKSIYFVQEYNSSI